MRQAAAATVEREVVECRGDQHVELTGLFVAEHEWIAIVPAAIAGARTAKGVRQRLFEMDAVLADGEAQPFGSVELPGGVVPVVDAVMVEGRAGADRAFPVRVTRDGERMVRPIDEIGGGGMGPLMRTQPILALMVVLVEQVVEVEHAIVEEGHAVADEIGRLGSEVLHRASSRMDRSGLATCASFHPTAQHVSRQWRCRPSTELTACG